MADRARITVQSIPDAYNPAGPPLKVLRTDIGTPLRAGTVWIWNKTPQEQPESYYDQMRDAGLNAVRLILFDTWEWENGYTTVRWTQPAYRDAILARVDRAVNFAAARGLYVVINSHNGYALYDAAWVDELWTVVAPRYANRTHVIYEAANEPFNNLGADGDTSGVNPGRLEAVRTTHDLIRSLAPATHIMVLTPPNVVSSGVTVTALGNLAQRFAALPGPAIDWTKTSVAYHPYAGHPASFPQAQDLRNLHARYPGWPSENNFPLSVTSATLGITDPVRAISYQGHHYINQTCEFLGLGWSMWNINGPIQFANNWPLVWGDAVAKGYAWTPDPMPAPAFTSLLAASFHQGAASGYRLRASPGRPVYAATGLPPGLSLHPDSGRLEGFATAAGLFAVGVTATTAAGIAADTLVLEINPALRSTDFLQTFAPASLGTAGWFSYASAGSTHALSNTADATARDGRALRVALQTVSGWFAGIGTNFARPVPFTAANRSEFALRGRLKVASPAGTSTSERVSLIFKTSATQSLTYTFDATEGQWVDFYAPVDQFGGGSFNYAASAWEILIAPVAGGWGNGVCSLALDEIELVRVQPITDPLEAWRMIQFGSIAPGGDAALDADPDGDGAKNLEEYALGTLPRGASSRPLVGQSVVEEAGARRLRVSFTPQRSDVVYRIETSSDLVNWTSFLVPSGAITPGQPYVFTDALNLLDPATPRRFARLRLER
jgi:hypothetical protein